MTRPVPPGAPSDRRRLKVLYSFPCPLGSPGTGTTALHQVRGLVEQGVDVTVYCTSLAADVPGVTRVVETMVVGGRRVPHRAVGVDRAWHYHDRRVARALARGRERFDLVHAWPQAALDTAGVARRLGIKAVREVPNTHTAHAYEVVARENEALGLAPPRSHSHSFNRARLDRELREYEAADLLLVPSAHVARTFLDRGFRPEQLAIHRYGCDPARFHPPAVPADRPFTALFAGRCEPRKGLHLALRAWIESGAAERGRFLVCGSFMPGYREVVAGLLAHPSVEELGFRADVAEAMRASDVLVLPSIEEGSALVTYEAQACGCVLVVSDAAGARCEHLRHGLVHRAGDLAGLTADLRRLGSDPALLARLREASLARADELTWQRAGERLVELYDACVRGALPVG